MYYYRNESALYLCLMNVIFVVDWKSLAWYMIGSVCEEKYNSSKTGPTQVKLFWPYSASK